MTNRLPCNQYANSLALKPADLSPDERAALQAHLATCPGCAATYADYQSLITRLRALPRPALPPLAPIAPDERPYLTILPDAPSGAWLPIPTPLPSRPRRVWPLRLSVLAAVLLLTILVGSLVAILIRPSQVVSMPPPPSPFTLHPGWQQIALYSGTGNRTLTEQGITLPRLWSYTLTCAGSGDVNIDLQGNTIDSPDIPDSFDSFNHISPCPASAAPTPSPTSFSLDDAPGTLDTIAVTADAHTSWAIQIVQPISQPTFTPLGQQWTLISGISADTNATQTGLDADHPPAYKTLDILLLCFGTGTGTLQLTPDLGTINFPACDGQPHFTIVHYPAPTIVKGVTIGISGDVLWLEEVFGCANQQQCAN